LENSNTGAFREQLLRLNRIGIALTSVHDLSTLLEMILKEARRFTLADAGSLYIVEEDRLRFMVSQNDTLKKRAHHSQNEINLGRQTVKMSKTSIAGYVAMTGETVNIHDAYNMPGDVPYKHSRQVDENLGYRTKSILAVPMKDHRDEIIGVLQLINSMNEKNEAIAFDSQTEDLVLSLASQAAVAINNARLTAQIKNAHLDTIFRLAAAAEYRDPDTALHLKRMSRYSSIVAEEMGLNKSEIELIRYSSPMHDVGKIGIPDAILLKPGRLTKEEREVMETHASIGAKLLSQSESNVLKVSESVAGTHHEKFDGTGYPNGLKGEEIPLFGRIVALADVFDALSSKRCYKEAMPFTKVVSIVKEERGRHFDPQVVDAFLKGISRIESVLKQFGN